MYNFFVGGAGTLNFSCIEIKNMFLVALAKQ